MADAAAHADEHHDTRGFFTRWFMSTNHKDIGILYLFTAAILGFVSVGFTVYMLTGSTLCSAICKRPMPHSVPMCLRL